jgi:NAD(P)-dependent dehydrogenase (short-subunit alcohol dehydrogenase family)
MPILEGKTALVTGAGQGIGRAIAVELAEAGADVVLTHLDTPDNRERAENVKAEVEAVSRRAFVVPMDVTDITSIREGLKEVFRHVTRVDIVVNNAGVMQQSAGLDTRPEDFDRCYEVNLKSIWYITHELIPRFKAQGEGNIINISSGAGRLGSPELPAYCASKAAVISLTQSLATALGPHNINVNTVCPGVIWTPMCEQTAKLLSQRECDEKGKVQAFLDSRKDSIPLRRLQTGEDIAHAVVFLASSRARNITGQALNVDGGLLMN